jgi:hypothetical protein
MDVGLTALLAAHVGLAFLTLAVLNPGPDMRSQELVSVFYSAPYEVLATAPGGGLVIPGSLLVKPGNLRHSSDP